MKILPVSKALRQLGVLGINGRNCEYTSRFNPRHYYPRVDDKLQTKKLALAAGLAVPKLYGVVEIEHHTVGLPALLRHYEDFVIKPAHGSSGDGVLVIKERTKNAFRLTNGETLDLAQLQHYVSNILGGLYSLGGHPDKALIEYRVKADAVFSAITHAGVPDVRIVVFKGVPAMAMVRLPTQTSGGKANLHQGAIGAGIELGSGRTLHAVGKNNLVYEHPDTGETIAGREVPHWQTLLEIAAQCYELTGLGYVGVDIVLDAELGPLILEINARPGLNIQIANGAGLRPRLERIEQQYGRLPTIADRVAFARSDFN